jgi:hypothetical protein
LPKHSKFPISRQGISLEAISEAIGYDRWFLAQMFENVNCESEIANCKSEAELQSVLRHAQQMGFADSHIARLLSAIQPPLAASDIRALRAALCYNYK